MPKVITIRIINGVSPPDPVLSKEKAKYRKMLRELCPSKETRKRARRISERKGSCDRCVYGKCEYPWCAVPYTDGYMEDLEIDPCYEGVLKYLVCEPG